MILRACLALLGIAASTLRPAHAEGLLDFSQHRWEYTGEAGLLVAPRMDIHGYQQNNATAGWTALAPTVRLEAWLKREDALNIGVVLQPLFLSYRGNTISSQLTYRGQSFAPGDPAKLTYQFPSVRLTANYDLWPGDAGEFRVGLSLISRWVQIELSSPTARFTKANILAVPLLNLEAGVRLDERYRLVARADLFPAGRNAGFYDIFAGVRYRLDSRRAVEVGSRTFFGGYLPDTPNELNNRVVFQGIVGRFVF